MDLMIAVLHLTTVIDVRQTDVATRRLTTTTEEHRAGRAAVILLERGDYAVPLVDAIASGNGTPEVEQARVNACTRLAVECSAFLRRQHPDTDTIPIRRGFGSARMITARLAAVFDVHAEQDRPRSSAAIRIGPVTDTGEDDLVGRCFAWLRSGDTVARIAAPRHRRGVAELIEASSGIEVHAQAGAIQRVIEPGMEVTFQATLDVPDMCPAAMDADIADDIIHQERLGQQVVAGALVWTIRDGIAIRGADLAAVSDVA